MKLLKLLTIVLFSLIISVSILVAQENNTADSAVSDSNTGNTGVVEAEINTTQEIKTDPVTKSSDTADRNKTAVPVNKNENRKTVSKNVSENKTVTRQEEAVIAAETPVKMEGELLPINEGNFKYKRIPDIKLVDIIPEASVSNTAVTETAVTVQDPSKGFLGMSKTASDIIVKGGVLLLILIIFVLYKSRMTGPGNKSSKRRNVLNSYRK